MFNIVFLTSTKQHYGLTEVDTVTLKDLFKKSQLVRKVDKLAHIKIIPGDEKIALEKTQFFKSLGFEVILPINKENEKCRWTWGFDGKIKTKISELIVVVKLGILYVAINTYMI